MLATSQWTTYESLKSIGQDLEAILSMCFHPSWNTTAVHQDLNGGTTDGVVAQLLPIYTKINPIESTNDMTSSCGER